MICMKKRVTIKTKINRLVSVGKPTPNKPSPRKEIVEAASAILAKPENKKFIKYINRISITRCVPKSGFRVTGRVVTKPDGTIIYKIIDDGEQSIEYYKSCIVHELAHVQWPVLYKWHNEAQAKFIEIAESCGPVNEYGRKNEQKWRSHTSRGTPQVSHWANELHSAAAELYYHPEGRHDWLGTQENIDKLLAAYRELHGLHE